MIVWLGVNAPDFATKLLDFTQGPFVAVGTFVTFGSGLYAFSEWVFGSFERNMVFLDAGGYRRNWDRLGQAVNQGVAMGFLAGAPWFGVALWAGLKGFG